MDNYKPISRNVYEVLEELHLLKQECILTFWDAYQKRTLVDTHITDLYTEEEGEYLITGEGIRIRLDHLLAINGKPVEFFV